MKSSKCFRRVLAFLLTAVLVAAVLPLNAFAESAQTVDNGTWKYNYYLSGYIRLRQYTGSSEHVTVPSYIGAIPVTGFENDGVFTSNNTVKSITFDLQVGSIPLHFCSGCTALESITLPDSVLFIDENAFDGCSSLSHINIPASVKSIGYSAFRGCSSLTEITFSSSLKTIGNQAFNRCTGLETVNFGNGLTEIGYYAFANCTSLASVALPDSVVTVKAFAFYNCSELKSAVLPDGLSILPSSMFADCTSLETVNIPTGVSSIRDAAFRNCLKLDNITLPSGLRSIQDKAFRGCSSLTSIHIPGSVSNIGASAFAYCDSLQTVVIDYGVLTIGESEVTQTQNGHDYIAYDQNISGYTFSCNNSTKIYITTSIMKVEGGAFTKVGQVYLDGTKNYLDRIEFAGSGDKSKVIYRIPVSFDMQGKDAYVATLYPYGDTNITLPDAPAAEGYTFDYWLPPNNSQPRYAGSTYTITQNVESYCFRAHWTANENAVTFRSEKGTVPPAQTVFSGNKATEPACQVVGNEYLEGWYKNSDFSGDKYDFDTVVLGSFNLYAKWVSAPLVNVTLSGAATGNSVSFVDKDDSSVVYASFTQSGSAYVPRDAVMKITKADGYDCSGVIENVYMDANNACTSAFYDIVNNIDSYTLYYGNENNITVSFTDTPVVITNITSDNNLATNGLWTLTDGRETILTDGSAVNLPQGGVVAVDDLLSLTLSVPDGYGCDGTIINGNSTIQIIDGITSYTGIEPAGNITLNLHFYSRENYVTLYFTNSADGRCFTEKYPVGTSEFVFPENPYTNSNGFFSNWNTAQDGNGTEYQPNSTESLPSVDTNYYAVWDAAYFLSFSKNGGSGSMTKIGVYATSPTLRVPESSYTRNGYAFTGWNTKSNGSGVSYQPDDGITLSENTTLYAQWAQAYTVYLHRNYDGTSYIRQEVIRGQTANIMAAPYTREGYVFGGWTTNSDGTGNFYADAAEITPTATMYLYAKWISEEDILTLADDAQAVLDRDGDTVFGIGCAFTLLNLKLQFKNAPARLKVLDGAGEAVSSYMSCIGTGNRVQLVDADDSAVIIDEVTAIVYGDVNGDGAVDAFDMFSIDKVINNSNTLDGAYLTAGDLDGDGSIQLSDYIAVCNDLSGASAINQGVKP